MEILYKESNDTRDNDDEFANIPNVIKIILKKMIKNQETNNEKMTLMIKKISDLEKKVNSMEDKLNFKINKEEFFKILEKKDQEIKLKSSIKDVKEAFKINKNEFNLMFEEVLKIIKDIKKKQFLKSNIKDIVELTKQKLSKKTFNIFLKQQKEINEYNLQQKRIVAQWVWNSQKLVNGKAIPWDIEIKNSSKDTFIFKKGHYNIIVKQAGLYNILLYFFNFKKEIIINFFINNEVFYTKSFKPPPFIDNNDKKSLNDILVFKQNSKIAISINFDKGEKNIEGILSIQKI